MASKKVKIKKPKTFLRKKKQKKISGIRARQKSKRARITPEEHQLISPKTEHTWEASQTFNPGVILLDNKVHFLYRAIGADSISRLGYAVSGNGFHINERLPHPVYEHRIEQPRGGYQLFSYFSGGSFGGAEDARPVRVDEENVLYMTYTACDDGLRVALTSIAVGDFLKRKWKWKLPVFISPPGELHKNWLLFPEKINGKYAFLLSIVPEPEIVYVDDLDFDGTRFMSSFRGFGPLKNDICRGSWDKWVRGAGPTPLKTKYGWLVFYHAMDNDWSKYKVGAMILDLNDPTKILYRSKEPILEPSEYYQKRGFKPGVVYATGAVVKDGNLLVYYGISDSYVSVACFPFEEFLNALVRDEKLKSEKRLQRKRAYVH